MIITKEEKISIYTDLFKNGTMVIKRDKKKENKIKSLPVKVILEGLKSKGMVKETFSWQFHFYTLSDEGVKYLQNYLNIPEKVVPLTHKQPLLW